MQLIQNKMEKQYLPFKTGDFELKPLSKDNFFKTAIGIPSKQSNSPMYIKFLNPKYAKDKKITQQFKLEGKIIHALNGRQFPKYNEHGLINNTPYIAYNYLKGMSLSYLMLEKPQQVHGNVRFAIGILSQLLNALTTLHNRDIPIIHGDINPQNILIGDKGHIYLVDFGCAHFKKNNSEHNSLDHLIWKNNIKHKSPEQMSQESWDEKSDIYQVASIFYEIVTGKKINSIRSISIKTKLLPSNFLDNEVGKEMSVLISKMLQPLPEKRCFSATEFLKKLETIIAKEMCF